MKHTLFKYSLRWSLFVICEHILCYAFVVMCFLSIGRSISRAGVLQQLPGISGKEVTSSLWSDKEDECSGNDQCCRQYIFHI
jgi:hypothetical protein